MNPRFPDFKHKQTKASLWLHHHRNPPWVISKMALIPPGMLQVNVFSWTQRLLHFNKAGQYEKTLKLFKQMQKEGINADRFVFVHVLNACAGLQVLEAGRHVHIQIKRAGCESDCYVGTSLIDMYAKCGSIEDAVLVFNKMPGRNVVAWNAMMMGYVKGGQARKALELSQLMQQERVVSDPITFVWLLKSCANLAALEEGRLVHKQIIESGCESDIFVGSSLVDMYTKCWSIEDAWRVFMKLPKRDVFVWSAMILGYVKCGEGQKALELFQQMQQEGVVADSVIFVGLLNACASLGSLERGKHVHEQIVRRGCESNIFVGSSLVDMYAKCGSLEDAWRVFNKMPTRNVVAWNALILGLAKCGQGHNALELFQQMQLAGMDPNSFTYVGVLYACASVASLEVGQSVHKQILQSDHQYDIFVGGSLVDMYAKCGSIEDAWSVFSKMPVRNVVAWNSMIMGCVSYGQWQRALELSKLMEDDRVIADSSTFVGLLNACAGLAVLEEGRSIHKQIIQNGCESCPFVGSSLVNMYSKCGSIEDAWKVFNKLPKRTVIAWNAMIMGCVKCGQAQEALKLSEQMQRDGVFPDSVTFVGLLSACASVAALDQGKIVHKQIIQSGCESDTFVGSSLVDMYAKCGSIEDALKVFNTLRAHDAVFWNAMIGGFAIHGLAKEALSLFQQMCLESIDVDEVTFVSLLSACSHAGLVEEGLHYFELMTSVYGICPTIKHYTCMVDLLGRADRLGDAEEMINSMSLKPDASVWMSLLGACRIHSNVEMGERAAKQVLELDPENPGGYVLLSNTYAAAGNWHSSSMAHGRRLDRGVSDQPGCSLIMVNNEVH